MTTMAALALENGTLDSFLLMKDDLRLLLPQLQMFESFEFLPSSTGTIDSYPTLAMCEQEVTNLARQLRSKMQEYSARRLSINKGRPISSIVQDPRPIEETRLTVSPISRCPDCLLVSIFELVTEEGSHNILPLLSVNKRFYQLAMSNPTLWRKIFITINEYLSEVNSLSTSYVKVCLERSKEALLDIILDCEDALAPFEFMRGYISNLVSNAVVDEVDKKGILNYLSAEFTEPHGYPDYSDWEFSFYKRKLESVLVIICSLIVSGQAHVRRWRSSIITFPSTSSTKDIKDIKDAIWKIFELDMPNLRSFKGNTLAYIKSGDISEEFLWPTLKELTISESVKLNQVPINFPSLTTFKFHHYNDRNNLSNWAVLSQCAALQELCITCNGFALTDPPRVEVNLPMLVSLSLENSVGTIHYVRFNSPKLERWNLICGPYYYVLPEADPVHFKWIDRNYTTRNSFDREVNYLAMLLSTFKKTSIFTVERLHYAERCFAKICEMKAEKKLPDCLRMIEIVGAGSLDLAGYT